MKIFDKISSDVNNSEKYKQLLLEYYSDKNLYEKLNKEIVKKKSNK